MKKAQASTQFAWVFIIIAGAVILLFFVSMVYRQKGLSEEKLSGQVLSKLETIFSGAGLSSGTVNLIDIPETNLGFVCEDEFSEFYIKETSLTQQFPSQVIFSMDTLKGDQLIAWALGWNVPFKTTNFLYLSDPDIKYYLVGEDIPFYLGIDIPDEFDIEKVDSIDEIENIEGYHKVKMVFFGDSIPSLSDYFDLEAHDISVMRIRLGPDLSSGEIHFYKKTGNRFRRTGQLPYIDLPSMFGAVFSENREVYECGMMKAFKKLSLVGKVYEGRSERINDTFSSQVCKLSFSTNNPVSSLVDAAEGCSERVNRVCINSVEGYRDELVNLQQSLIFGDCAVIY